MWWTSSLAREQSRDNPYRALQTVPTKKWATAVVDVLMLKQLIPASCHEEFSFSFPFLGPTSSAVLMPGADAPGTAWSLSSLSLEFANLLTLSVFILAVISSHFEALRYSLTPLMCCGGPLFSITLLCVHKCNQCAAAWLPSTPSPQVSQSTLQICRQWDVQVRINVGYSESEPCDTLLNRAAGTHK